MRPGIQTLPRASPCFMARDVPYPHCRLFQSNLLAKEDQARQDEFIPMFLSASQDYQLKLQLYRKQKVMGKLKMSAYFLKSEPEGRMKFLETPASTTRN